jgi:hypothetical protein
MKRARIPQIFLAALLASAVAGAAPAGEIRGGAAPAAFSGVYEVTFTVNATSVLAPGTAILCKAKDVPNAPALEDFRWGAVPVASALATVTGSAETGYWANCTVRIPFYWTAENAQGSAVLSYEIDLVDRVVSGPGAEAVTLRRQERIGVAYPAPGGTASLNLKVSF